MQIKEMMLLLLYHFKPLKSMTVGGQVTYEQLNELKYLDVRIRYLRDAIESETRFAQDCINLISDKAIRKDMTLSLKKLVRLLRGQLDKVTAQKDEGQKWIAAISDSYVQDIVYYHCLEGMPFVDICIKHYPGSTPEALSSTYYRFLHSQGIRSK